MKHPEQLLTVLLMGVVCTLQAQRSKALLEKNWRFSKGNFKEASQPEFNDTKWESVVIPHGWAILGPFDMSNGLQNVVVTQNFEKEASLKTGRTGGLPHVDTGQCRTSFNAPADKEVTLLFDGIMNEARVYVNGKEACFWFFDCNSLHCNVTSLLNKGGENDTLVIRLKNHPQSSHWYPGASLYCNTHLIVTDRVHVPVWGIQITTPHVSKDFAAVRLQTKIDNADGKTQIRIETEILSPDGEAATSKGNTSRIDHEQPFERDFIVNASGLWSPENPPFYKAVSKIYADDKLVDTYTTRFGIRNVEYIADKGFYLNGKHRKFQGVCNHHDLGLLGTAINMAALCRRLTLLKDTGCDVIRTSHNTPTPELVALCDEMGLMMMIEPFDKWDIAKCKNGYRRYLNERTEHDMANMLHSYRDNPCVITQSIDNKVPTQCSPVGYEAAKFLQDICHREDPICPVTYGMDQVACVFANESTAMIDIPGLNYRTQCYRESCDQLPQNLILGSEAASTVNLCGVYKSPVEDKESIKCGDHQRSSYDVEACSWLDTPDEGFILADDNHWTIGRFVWTGFNYLDEPSPYDTDTQPSHSPMFGITGLASLPKDRYYLYHSAWNKDAETLYILPHQARPGRGGEVTPVFAHANYPIAELFINGKSYGKQSKNNGSSKSRYCLVWMDVVYEPGEMKVVAHNKEGKAIAERVVHTAGKAHYIELVSNRSEPTVDGKDLAYVAVKAVDKNSNLCSTDSCQINFSAKGTGKYRAAVNGNPTSLEQFYLPKMRVFSGMLTAIVQAGKTTGEIVSTAKANRVKTGNIRIQMK